MVRIRSDVCVTLALVFTLGCGKSDRAKLAAVSGTVTYQGQPLSEGDVVFYPEEGRSAIGKIVDGNIVDVMTYEPNDGAPIGSLRIGVSVPGSIDTPVDKPVIPPKFADPTKSGLTATINAGEKNVVDLELVD